MDGQRFDDVARLIGTGASRRSVVKGILASALGLGGVGVVRSLAGAVDAPISCMNDGDCPEGTICCESGNESFCVSDECCGPDDDHCAVDEFCTDEKICVLLSGRDECQEDSDCLEIQGESEIPAICCGGVCAQIECCTDDEDPNARCADGTSCFEGYCDPICSSDDDCDTDTCCCPDGTCSGDCCEATGPVNEPETPVDEPETPVVLPNTGAGSDSGNGALLGAGLLAAGAAYLAGKKLNAGAESE